jgi:hypothetical protein
MSPARRLAWVMASTLSLTAGAAGFDAPVLELGPVLGARAWSGTDDSVLLGGHLTLGVRLDRVRFGVVGQALYARTFNGLGVDLGAFVSWDFVLVDLDSRLSAGAFLRLDGAARYLPSANEWGAVPRLSIGGHAGGYSISVGAGPELGLHLPGGSGWGFTADVRFGVELFEAVWLFERIREEDSPP